MKNLLGENVQRIPLTFRFNDYSKTSGLKDNKHLAVLRGKHLIAFVSINGWNGYGHIQHDKGEPILTNLHDILSFKELNQIMEEWNKCQK